MVIVGRTWDTYNYGRRFEAHLTQYSYLALAKLNSWEIPVIQIVIEYKFNFVHIVVKDFIGIEENKENSMGAIL